jgi:hypothetical protein
MSVRANVDNITDEKHITSRAALRLHDLELQLLILQ